MAKITDLEVLILGERHKLPIKCSAKGTFSTDWPVSTRSVPKSTQEFASKKGLEDEIHRVVKIVNELETTYEDVICYVFNKRDPWAYNGKDTKVELKLYWAAWRKVTLGTDVKWIQVSRIPTKYDPHTYYENLVPPDGFYLNGWASSGFHETTADPSGRDVSFIPFSEENFAFFEKVTEAMNVMRTKITDFLSPDNIHLSIAQATGNLQLMG